MEFSPLKSGVPVIVRMLSFIKTEVNVIREVGMLDESLVALMYMATKPLTQGA